MAIAKPLLYFVSDKFSERVKNSRANQCKSSGGEGIATA